MSNESGTIVLYILYKSCDKIHIGHNPTGINLHQRKLDDVIIQDS